MKKTVNEYNENFIDIKLSPATVFVYSVRKLIQRAIDKSIPLFKGIVVDLGCGEMPYKKYLLRRNKKIKKYIGVDIENSQYHTTVKPDIYWNGKKINLKKESADVVLATELFEHLPDLSKALNEIYRILNKKGKLIFTVPFIWPLHETPHDEYRYTPYSLIRILTASGFKNVKLIPLGGYNASLAQMLCIWINSFRPRIKSRFRRNMFEYIEKKILYLLINKLLEQDVKINVSSYGENTMPTGFYGYAEK